MGLTKEEQRNKIRGYAHPTLKDLDEIKQDKRIKANIQNRKYKICNILVRGIYKLYQDNEVVYVGQSKTNVFMRISQHYAECIKEFDSFSFIECTTFSDAQLDSREKKMILSIKPKYNTIFNSPNKPLSRQWQKCTDVNYKKHLISIKKK